MSHQGIRYNEVHQVLRSAFCRNRSWELVPCYLLKMLRIESLFLQQDRTGFESDCLPFPHLTLVGLACQDNCINVCTIFLHSSAGIPYIDLGTYSSLGYLDTGTERIFRGVTNLFELSQASLSIALLHVVGD